MGNATSSVAEMKKKSDRYHEAVRAERNQRPGLSQQMSSKRFKKSDPFAEQWKVRSLVFVCVLLVVVVPCACVACTERSTVLGLRCCRLCRRFLFHKVSRIIRRCS